MSPVNLPYQINLNRSQQRSNSTKQLFPHRLSSGSACDTCRRRKTKCDGGSPCAYCANNNMQCIHRPSKRKKAAVAASAAILIAKNNNYPLKKDSSSSASCSSTSSSPISTLAAAAASTDSLPLLIPSEYNLEASDYHQSFSNPLNSTLTRTDKSYGMPSMMDQLSCYTFTAETVYGKRYYHY